MAHTRERPKLKGVQGEIMFMLFVIVVATVNIAGSINTPRIILIIMS